MDVIIETPLEELYRIPTNYVVVGTDKMLCGLNGKNGWYLDGDEDNSIYRFYHYKNDKIHNDNGPARIETLHSFPEKIYALDWYKQNLLHRIDGPAEIWLNLDKENHYPCSFCYRIDGIELSKENWLKHPQVINYVANSIVEL